MIKETSELLDLFEALISHEEKGESLPEAIIYSFPEIAAGLGDIWEVPEELMALDPKESALLTKRSFSLIKRALLLYAKKL